MKISNRRLREIIAEEIAISAPAIKQAISGIVVSAEPAECDLSEELTCWLGSLKCCRDWFHGAHHVVKGPSFSGDHVELFGKIYSGIEEDFDGDVEKAIGVSGDIAVACPQKICATAMTCMQQYPSPCNLTADEIAKTGLDMVMSHIAKVETLFTTLEGQNCLTLGLNDHLSAQANTFESYAYLLKQRCGC